MDLNSLSQSMETTWVTDTMRSYKDKHQMDLRETVYKWTGLVGFRTGSREGRCEHGSKPADFLKTRTLDRPTQPWVFKPRPARLYYATRGHICKLCI
jgi:hypothetical protein